jgi:hypothetical protein
MTHYNKKISEVFIWTFLGGGGGKLKTYFGQSVLSSYHVNIDVARIGNYFLQNNNILKSNLSLHLWNKMLRNFCA